MDHHDTMSHGYQNRYINIPAVRNVDDEEDQQDANDTVPIFLVGSSSSAGRRGCISDCPSNMLYSWCFRNNHSGRRKNTTTNNNYCTIGTLSFIGLYIMIGIIYLSIGTIIVNYIDLGPNISNTRLAKNLNIQNNLFRNFNIKVPPSLLSPQIVRTTQKPSSSSSSSKATTKTASASISSSSSDSTSSVFGNYFDEIFFDNTNHAAAATTATTISNNNNNNNNNKFDLNGKPLYSPPSKIRTDQDINNIINKARYTFNFGTPTNDNHQDITTQQAAGKDNQQPMDVGDMSRSCFYY